LKLLFTQDALVNAGAERSHLELLSRFSEQTAVSLVYFYPKHDLKEEYEKAGIRLIFLNIPETYHFGMAVARLIKLIRSEKPDLLISSLWRADIITRIASIITGVPLIGTLVNDSYGPIAWKDKKGLKYKLVYWLDRLTAGIPVHWIANAEALTDSHVKTLGLNSSKISVVYRGRSVPETQWEKERVEIERLDNAGLGKRDLGEENPDSYGEENGRLDDPDGSNLQTWTTKEFDFRFISYGRLLERKGFQDAILAFSELVKSHPNSSYTIYGEGPFRTELEALIQSLGLAEKVLLPGKIPDPTALLPTAHCFLFPSWYEGFSGALVEAMMAGIPIVASDISMNLEAVVDQENALVFPVGEHQILAAKMRWMIDNPSEAAALGTKARMSAIQRFDIEKIAKEYEEVILSVGMKNKS
jgi:glycosyltransferase involved in cell wall biosynthesis